MTLRKNAWKESAPSLAAIKQAAWELGVVLVEQADFSASSSNAGKVQVTLTQLHPASSDANYELLSYAGWGASSFIIDKKHPSEESTMPFFSIISYRGPEQGVVAEFNEGAYEELGQLQRGIRVLRQQNALTPANLTRVMRNYTPYIKFRMVVRHLPKAPITLLVNKLLE